MTTKAYTSIPASSNPEPIIVTPETRDGDIIEQALARVTLDWEPADDDRFNNSGEPSPSTDDHVELDVTALRAKGEMIPSEIWEYVELDPDPCNEFAGNVPCRVTLTIDSLRREARGLIFGGPRYIATYFVSACHRNA
jgi:hypothetical protein